MVIDFEFVAQPGEVPVLVSMVAKSVRSGSVVRASQSDLEGMTEPPFPIDENTLYVAYFASAEVGCHLALGWPVPKRIFDCYTEFRALTNGRPHKLGNGLLAAMAAYGLDSMVAEEKRGMRELILSGGPWTQSEQRAILRYNEQDVIATEKLFPLLFADVLKGGQPEQRLGQALLRGRYMVAVARMEYTGVPIDTETLGRLKRNWKAIQARLIAEVDNDFGVYEDNSFKAELFAGYLERNRIPWPRTERGYLALDAKTFREMSKAYPKVAPLEELRHTLSELRLNRLAVGADGRNRTMISPFGARTGRNTPSNAKFIFGPSRWLRGLIKPKKGYGLAYVDFASQEVAIAGALSGDSALMEAYRTGDVYLAFAKQAGMAPQHATKKTHKVVRDKCKAVVLGTQYGMGAHTLGQRLGIPEIGAKRLLDKHQATYPTFWEWSEGAVDSAMLTGKLETVFGWPVHVGDNANPRSLRNFPCQANGAEMLRLACCMATEAGLSICAPVHDALLLEAPLGRLEKDVARLQAIMAEAGRVVLDGFEVIAEVDKEKEIVRYPNRYMDERGTVMWGRVMEILDKIEAESIAYGAKPKLPNPPMETAYSTN